MPTLGLMAKCLQRSYRMTMKSFDPDFVIAVVVAVALRAAALRNHRERAAQASTCPSAPAGLAERVWDSLVGFKRKHIIKIMNDYVSHCTSNHRTGII